LFDSGAAFGRAEASVPFAGSGTAGEIVQARAISLDDGGATTTPWTDVATIAAGGLWSGTIVAPRSSSWYRPEVRLKATTGVTAQGVNRFGVGHVMAIWGQSEPDRILSSFYDNTTPPAVSDPEAVQIIFGAAASPSNHFVTTAQPYTAAVAALASSLIATRPDEKFAVIFHTVSGTDVRALVNDGDTSRSWLADKALHDYATADGQKVGFAAMSWFAAPGSLGSYYGQALFPLLSGKMLDGTPVSFPATIPSGVSSSFHADHWFGELYDYTNTKWVAYGPHRFDIDADMQDATHLLGGATQFALTNKQDARASWRAMLAAPAATMLLPLGLEPVAYVNGTNTGAGGWTDVPHPAGDTPDGAQAFARLTGLAILQAAGMTSWAVPEFDNRACHHHTSGAQRGAFASDIPALDYRPGIPDKRSNCQKHADRRRSGSDIPQCGRKFRLDRYDPVWRRWGQRRGQVPSGCFERGLEKYTDRGCGCGRADGYCGAPVAKPFGFCQHLARWSSDILHRGHRTLFYFTHTGAIGNPGDYLSGEIQTRSDARVVAMPVFPKQHRA
jgi:hypothetical protein